MRTKRPLDSDSSGSETASESESESGSGSESKSASESQTRTETEPENESEEDNSESRSESNSFQPQPWRNKKGKMPKKSKSGFGGFSGPGVFGMVPQPRGFHQAHDSSRSSWLQNIEEVERNIVSLDIAEKYLRDKIPAVVSLSEEITGLDEPEDESLNPEKSLEVYKLRRIREVLAEDDRVYVDEAEHKALVGLKAEKEREKVRIAEAKKKLVLQELSERVRFMDLKFEEEFIPYEVAQTSRQIEVEYKNMQIVQLQKELESQRQLTLTIARAQMGDTGPDQIDIDREKAKRAIEAQKEATHRDRIEALKKRLLQLRVKMEEQLIDTQMKKFKRIPENTKSVPSSDNTGPTDGDSEDESTIPRGTDEPLQVAGTALPHDSPATAAKKSKKSKKVRVVSEETEEVTTKLFGLSTEVKCELWDALQEPSWKKVLLGEAQQPYFTYLSNWLQNLRKKVNVYPPTNKVFEAFNLCPLDKVRVVIVGQDPYHDKNQANGLCFSVSKKTKIPPSLRNVYGELKKNYPQFKVPKHGDLTEWANRGVLLLNSVLTVEEKKPRSHTGAGWQNFTDVVIKILNERKEPIVFMLWGNYAKKKCDMINRHRHRVVENAHPSPLSFARWTGCKTFSRCDKELVSLGYPPMNWAISS